MTTMTVPEVAVARPSSSLPWLRHSLSLAGRSIKKMMRHP